MNKQNRKVEATTCWLPTIWKAETPNMQPPELSNRAENTRDLSTPTVYHIIMLYVIEPTEVWVRSIRHASDVIFVLKAEGISS